MEIALSEIIERDVVCASCGASLSADATDAEILVDLCEVCEKEIIKDLTPCDCKYVCQQCNHNLHVTDLGNEIQVEPCEECMENEFKQGKGD